MPDPGAIDVGHFLREGFAESRGVLISASLCDEIAGQITQESGVSQRHLIDHPSVLQLLRHDALTTSVKALLGPGAFAYKATLFDKSSEANWLVAWHQDVAIPITHRADIPGWRGWSVKDGVHYAQPTDDVLADLLAVRIHLDTCNETNGPLRLLAGSHARGRLPAADVASSAAKLSERTICGPTGSALFMRPLLVHASSKATSGGRRRVLHLEFASRDLTGMGWHRRIAI